MKKPFLSFLVFLTALVPASAQKIVVQNPTFSTQTPQLMWGPGNTLGLDQNFDIFPQFRPGPFYFDTSPYTMFKIEGIKIGVAIDGHIDFGVGPLTFEMNGFNAGEIEISYPAEIKMILPDDNSFNPGETIVIKSAFNAYPSAKLLTQYPQLGQIKLDLDLMFGVGMKVKACFGDCVETTLIPTTSVTKELILFDFNRDAITYICNNTSDPIAFLQNPFQCTLDISQPWVISDPSVPLSLTASLPNVVTTSAIAPDARTLLAVGEHNYLTPSLDVIGTLGMIPGPVGTAIGLLDSEITIPVAPDITGDMKGITIDWAIAAISLNLPITHNQEFDFKPQAFTTLTFPDEVEYVVHSLKSGDAPGKGTKITYEVGDSVSIKFPCNYQFMDIYASHSFNGRVSNKTFDDMGLNIGMELFKFEVTIDDYVLFPEICIPIPFIGDECTPELVISAPTIPTLGPLYEDTFVLLDNVAFPAYFDKNWKITNFNTVDIPAPFRLQPRQLAPVFSTTNVTCNGDANGTITTNFANAAVPLEYKWSFESTAPNPVNVPAGTHSVKITDKNGCVFNDYVTITQPLPVALELQSSEIKCYGGSEADITVTARGGSGGYTYLWNTGEATAGILDKPAGLYSVTVSDINGCNQTASVTIDEPPELTAAIYYPKDPTCYLGDNGTLDLFVEGGTAPYTYSWSNLASSQAVEGLSAQTYTVDVKDANGCSVTDNHTLGQPSPMLLTVSKLSDIDCFGGSDGSLSASVSGGTPPYQYSWYNESITLGKNTPLIDGLRSGAYTVEVTDKYGCRIVKSQTIAQPEMPLFGSIEATHLSCPEFSDGSLSLSVEGGTQPYSFRWNNGANSQDLSGLDKGVYEVEITDNKGCTFKTKTLLIAPPEISNSVRIKNVSCSLQKDGSVEVSNISGGTAPYEVEFSTGDVGLMLEELSDGIYSFTITDQSGCSVDGEFEILKSELECLKIPSAFSPNGDGINDTWEIENIELYPKASVRVFNKWNIDVFRTETYRAWEGVYNGNPIEPGVYFYIVDLHNGSPIRTGSLVIAK